MNATQLFHADGKPSKVFFCGKCRMTAATQENAEQCCQNYKCQHCGVDTGSRSWLSCDACRRKIEDEAERRRFEKAEKVTSWDGPIYCEGLGYNEGFFESVEDLWDYLGDEEELETGERKAPEYVWTCDCKPICSLDYDEIIENATQDAHEGWEPDQLTGAEALKSALDAFNEANKEQVGWEPNFKKALLIEPQRATKEPSEVEP